jgi:exonuclease SbcD
VRILHSSDFHLRVSDKKYTLALSAVLDAARKNKADVLTIGGDIFDSPADANEMRGDLREIFRDIPFRVIAIPGNHDGKIFSKGFDFGFEVVSDSPWKEIVIDDVIIVPVPYTDNPTSEVLSGLKKAASSAKTRVLLLHCTLDIGFDSTNYGDDGSRKYFPISRVALSGLNYDFILAGHFHKDCQILKISDRSTFIYPGSPVSITKKESGKRYAVLIDTKKNTVKKIALPTFYYDSLTLDVRPGLEKEKIEELRNWYDERLNDECEVEIVVRGLMKQDEGHFKREIEKAAPKSNLKYHVKDIREILEHPLYKRFNKALIKSSQNSEINPVNDVVLEVMSGLIANEELD